MADLVSVLKSDIVFRQYLDGSFSKTKRAIPEKILFKETEKEKMVFSVLESGQVGRPAAPIVWLSAMRWMYLGFSLLPLLASSVLLLNKGIVFSWWVMLSSFLAVMLLQISVHFFNDYFDHMKGIDCLNIAKGSQVIQKGWIPAYQLLSNGKRFLFFAIILALPILQQNPWLVLLVGVVALIGVLEFSSSRLGLKYRGLGEAALFLLSGPLLTCGFSWVFLNSFDIDFLLLGFLMGTLSSFYFFVKNIAGMFYDQSEDKKSVQTLPGILGFDSSRVFALLSVWLPSCIVLTWLFYGVVGTDKSLWGVFFLQLVAAIGLFVLLLRTNSCISSNLLRIKKISLILHFLTGIALIFSFL